MSEPARLLPGSEAPFQSKFQLGTTLLAIGAGLVVDIGGTISSEMFVMSQLGLAAGLAHFPISFAELSKPSHDPAQLLAGFFHGMSFSFIGGYVAAVIGRNQPVLNAALFGVATTLTGLLIGGGSPLWINVLGIVTTVPLTMLAGYLVKRTYR